MQAVLSWPQPTTVKVLQHFPRFPNFYRCFIRSFSVIIAPFTSLLCNKPSTIPCSQEASTAIQTVQERFTSAPILRHLIPKLWYLLLGFLRFTHQTLHFFFNLSLPCFVHLFVLLQQQTPSNWVHRLHLCVVHFVPALLYLYSFIHSLQLLPWKSELNRQPVFLFLLAVDKCFGLWWFQCWFYTIDSVNKELLSCFLTGIIHMWSQFLFGIMHFK